METPEKMSKLVEDWYYFHDKIRREREVTLWSLAPNSIVLLNGVWLPIIIYTPFTPSRLRKKLELQLDVSHLVMLSRSYVDDNQDLASDLLDNNFGVLVCSDRSPLPLKEEYIYGRKRDT